MRSVPAAHHLNEDTASGASVALRTVGVSLHLDLKLLDHLFKARPLLVWRGEAPHRAVGVLITPELNAEPLQPLRVKGHVVRNHQLCASETLGHLVARLININPVFIDHRLRDPRQLCNEVAHRRV